MVECGVIGVCVCVCVCVCVVIRDSKRSEGVTIQQTLVAG
jgi:hypothetical protein